MSKGKKQAHQTAADSTGRKRPNKSGAEKRRVKKDKRSRNQATSEADLDPDFQFGASDPGDLNGLPSKAPRQTASDKSVKDTSTDIVRTASEQSQDKSEKRSRSQKRNQTRKRQKLALRQDQRAEKQDAQMSEDPVYERPTEAVEHESTTNGLTEGDDFISLNFDDSDTAAGPEDDGDSEDEKPTAFASIAEKLGKFVQDSIDPLKRKRNEPNDSKKSRKRKRVVAEKDPYPWLQGVSYAKEQEPARILHKELLDFVRYVGPTEEEHRVRTFVISRIQKLVEKKWPTASLHVFGSFETKLYLPTSDIDLVILSSETGEVYEKPTHLRRLANWLVKAHIAENIQVITSARVPIIKFIDSVTKINVDISFNKPSGLVAAGVVKRYTQKLPALRPLVVFIKHFLNMRGMNEVYLGGLGSYSIICMVISFLQRHPKVATGQILQEENLGVLVVEFLELYGKRFNYDNVGININGAGKYFSKVDHGWQRPGQSYLLSIEDPTDPENDIAKSSFGILKVKSTLGGGHDFMVQRLYDVNDRIKERRRADVGLDSILSAVVSIDEDMKESRAFIASCFDSDTVQEALERMEEEEGEIHEVPSFDPSALTQKKVAKQSRPEFVEEEESDLDLIDDDGHKFVRPDGYKKPSNPGDVDDLYSKLNSAPVHPLPPSSKESDTKAKPATTGKAAEEVFLIESSEDEALPRKSMLDGDADVIDLDTDNEEEDSKVAQVNKGARTRYWEAKGKDTSLVDYESAESGDEQ